MLLLMVVARAVVHFDPRPCLLFLLAILFSFIQTWWAIQPFLKCSYHCFELEQQVMTSLTNCILVRGWGERLDCPQKAGRVRLWLLRLEGVGVYPVQSRIS